MYTMTTSPASIWTLELNMVGGPEGNVPSSEYQTVAGRVRKRISRV